MNAPARTPTISASAIESFDPAQGGCARKWAFSRLDGVPKPQSPGAALGSRCHELWESYLRDGTPFDLSTPEGRICDATRHQLPAPGSCLAVEEAFRFGWEGVTWAGKKDVEYWDGTEGVDVVLDHKTTSDFRYAKSERSSLLGHPQAPLYAVEMLTRGNDGRAGLAWNYVKHNVTFDRDAPPNERGYTIKRAGRPVALEPPVRLIVGRAEAEDALGKHVPTAKRMLQIIAEPPAPVDGSIARALEPNPDACDAFGGCPYRAQCGLTPQEIAARFSKFIQIGKETAGVLNGVPGDRDMSSALRDRIAQIKADRAGNGPAQSTAVGVQQAIEAEAAARLAKAAVPQTSPFPQVAQATAMNTPAVGYTAPGMQGPTAYGPVNPPEGSLKQAYADAAKEIKAMAEESAPTPLPPAEAPTQPDAPAPKRRGRPPGSRNKVKGPEPLPDPEDSDLQAGGSTLPDGTKLDTIPAPPIGDADAARRVLRLLATTLLRALNEEDAR